MLNRTTLLGQSIRKNLFKQLLKRPYYQKRIKYKNNGLYTQQQLFDRYKLYKKYLAGIFLAGYTMRILYSQYYNENSSLQQMIQDIKKNNVSHIYYANNIQNDEIKNIEITYYVDKQKQFFRTKDQKQIYRILQYMQSNQKAFVKNVRSTKEQIYMELKSIAALGVISFLAIFQFKIAELFNRSGQASNVSNIQKATQSLNQFENFISVNEKHSFKKIKKTGVTFKDVAGMEESKLEIEEFVDFLKNPAKYNKIGATIPRGALLSGPPGTGKTLLAKACAGEAQVPFYSISGSEFVEVYVGVGAQRVRELFKTAKQDDVAIIFIDEIDSIGRKRASERSNSEHDSTLNQLLVEMDGFNTEQNIVVFGATNKKDMLDPALLRAGRFDRQIEVALPTLEGREQIFKVHLKPLKLKSTEFYNYMAKRLASLTPGFSGAEIQNVCNEAAIQAARRDHEFVLSEDFETAVERVIAGLEKKKQNNQEEKQTVAVHESGHAVVSWFLEGAMPLLKVTIIPRSKGALGFAQYLPNENQLQTQQEILDQITSVLGGRISEQIFFEKVTTGAYDDLQKAYSMAQNFVKNYGMDDDIGFVSYEEDSYGRKQYSEAYQEKVDLRVKVIIDQCTQRCREIVLQKKDLIQKMSEELMEKQTLDLKNIIKILGPRPFEPKRSFKAFLDA